MATQTKGTHYNAYLFFYIKIQPRPITEDGTGLCVGHVLKRPTGLLLGDLDSCLPVAKRRNDNYAVTAGVVARLPHLGLGIEIPDIPPTLGDVAGVPLRMEHRIRRCVAAALSHVLLHLRRSRRRVLVLPQSGTRKLRAAGTHLVAALVTTSDPPALLEVTGLRDTRLTDLDGGRPDAVVLLGARERPFPGVVGVGRRGEAEGPGQDHGGDGEDIEELIHGKLLLLPLKLRLGLYHIITQK
jgi:hypothetical protein